MPLDADGQGRDAARFRLGNARRVGAVNNAAGQVPEHIDHMRADGALHQLAKARAKAGQGGDIGEKREQNLGTHATGLAVGG